MTIPRNSDVQRMEADIMHAMVSESTPLFDQLARERFPPETWRTWGQPVLFSLSDGRVTDSLTDVQADALETFTRGLTRAKRKTRATR